jgi:hypothetical protein
MAAAAEPIPTLELPSGRPAAHQQHCDPRRAGTGGPLYNDDALASTGPRSATPSIGERAPQPRQL